jgi:hypothetical protein
VTVFAGPPPGRGQFVRLPPFGGSSSAGIHGGVLGRDAAEVSGVVANRVFGTLETEPKHKGLTLNSDTPYARCRWTCGWVRW